MPSLPHYLGNTLNYMSKSKNKNIKNFVKLIIS